MDKAQALDALTEDGMSVNAGRELLEAAKDAGSESSRDAVTGTVWHAAYSDGSYTVSGGNNL